MTERRQAHRREPIEVEVRDRVMEAHPIPWMKRNDLGNEIMRQYAELLNSSLRAVQDQDAPPQLEMYVNDKISDPIALVRLGYHDPDQGRDLDEEFVNALDYEELMELIYATLDVNQLESLRNLVDPNWNTPTTPGGTSSSGTEADQTDSQNQQSSPDSDSQESAEPTSST